MKISAGTIIKYKEKLLFCHPTNKQQVGTYTPAKGGIEPNESILHAAIRETKEEIGIDISESMIDDINKPIEILYINKKNEIYKKVYLFLVNITSLSQIGLDSEVVPKAQLQLEEVNYAKFLTKDEILKKALPHYFTLIDLL